jgi:hypothetical protein
VQSQWDSLLGLEASQAPRDDFRLTAFPRVFPCPPRPLSSSIQTSKVSEKVTIPDAYRARRLTRLRICPSIPTILIY